MTTGGNAGPPVNRSSVDHQDSINAMDAFAAARTWDSYALPAFLRSPPRARVPSAVVLDWEAVPVVIGGGS
ncbi:hypothetical protein [Aquisphaera insulae]|uniref:hypothetical protein n=1 Tax=Aquisphaera insulae TaxID=2712864 RepID=UPI0013EAF8A9|nr:hypothetical protein [Aquisphaera insulae]